MPHRSHVISLMLVAERDTDDVNCHVDVGLLRVDRLLNASGVRSGGAVASRYAHRSVA